MRLIPDPLPTFDSTLPQVRQALDQIRLEMMQVEHEFPHMTPHQVAREARRRCAGAMVAAANACEGRRARRRS